MNIPKSTPTAPPTGGSISFPWKHRLQYKSGKIDEAFAEVATPEKVKAGFTFYNKETAEIVRLNEFDAIVVRVMAGVSGTTMSGEKYVGWFSNLVDDTRTDVIQVRVQGVERVQASGLYSEIKNDLPQGVGFCQYLICYIPSIKETVALQLTVGLSHHLRACIASATNSPIKKVNLFGLCSLSSQYWGFSFAGGFKKTDKDGAIYSGKGQMYFMPECSAFTINKNDQTKDWFTHLDKVSDECAKYVSETQAKLASSTKEPMSAIKEALINTAVAIENVRTDTQYFPTDPPFMQPREADFSDLPF